MLNQATKLLSKDERLTSRGITISAVCPGWCRTGDRPATWPRLQRDSFTGHFEACISAADVC
jgi:NAD(P)-dependent dehydrogenase (short-subunit alcohol dehydrogenase family)